MSRSGRRSGDAHLRRKERAEGGAPGFVVGRAPGAKQLGACAQVAGSVGRWNNGQTGGDRSDHGGSNADQLGYRATGSVCHPDVARAVDRDAIGLVQTTAGIETGSGEDGSGTGEFDSYRFQG